MTHDGLGKYLKQKITKAPGADRRHRRHPQADQGRRARLLPAGGLRGGDQVVRRAGAGRPVSASSTACRCSSPARTTGASASPTAGLPIIGDDIKSQVGATIVHRQLARLFHERGVELQHTSQLNVGGNMDFFNMLERERLDSKKISKTNAVTSVMGTELPARRRPRRPVRLRAVADRPQVGPYPARGQVVRRRAADGRAQARGLGLAELGRRRDRRGPPDQAGAQQRRRRPARRSLQLPDEVAAQPASRRARRASRPRSSSPEVRAQGRGEQPAEQTAPTKIASS